VQTVILVSILLTILGGTVFYVWRYHTNISQKLSAQNEVAEFKYLLFKDFGRYRDFKFDGTLITFPEDSIVYQLGNPAIRTQGARTDTFNIASQANWLNEDISMNLQSSKYSSRFVLSGSLIEEVESELSEP